MLTLDEVARHLLMIIAVQCIWQKGLAIEDRHAFATADRCISVPIQREVLSLILLTWNLLIDCGGGGEGVKEVNVQISPIGWWIGLPLLLRSLLFVHRITGIFTFYLIGAGGVDYCVRSINPCLPWDFVKCPFPNILLQMMTEWQTDRMDEKQIYGSICKSSNNNRKYSHPFIYSICSGLREGRTKKNGRSDRWCDNNVILQQFHLIPVNPYNWQWQSVWAVAEQLMHHLKILRENWLLGHLVRNWSRSRKNTYKRRILNDIV